jgi:hypothetical protein
VIQALKKGPEGYFDARFGERSGAVRAKIAGYMAGCPAVAALGSRRVPKPGERELDMPTLRSDGVFVWSDAGMDVFRDGKIDLDPRFVAHVIRTKVPPTSVTNEQVEEALAALRQAG